jgi:hypothetical protein
MTARPGASRLVLAVSTLLLAAACGDDGSSTAPTDAGSPSLDASDDFGPRPLPPAPEGFERTVIDDRALGASFGELADVDGDGRRDLLYAHFGLLENPTRIPAGRVVSYLQRDGLTFERSVVVDLDEGIRFPNDPTGADVDGDGDTDVLVPHGFLVCNLFRRPCGGLSWFENDGGDWQRHTLVEAGSEAFYHRARLVDLDRDGVIDLVTVAETLDVEMNQDARVVMFRGTAGPDAFEKTPVELAPGMGSLFELRDLDDDGDVDIVSAELFTGTASFAWLEQVEAPRDGDGGTWVRHVIDDAVGPSIQLSLVDDLRGDGALWAVGSNHVNVHEEGIESAIYGYLIPTAAEALREPWEREALSEGIEAAPNEGFGRNAAPGIFGHGDVDGDGDVDLLVSGDGDPNVYWLEQQEDGFTTHVLQEDLPQAGGMKVVDLDGDGRQELVVSGYEHSVVLLYEPI